MAAAERRQRKISRRVGQRDASVAVDMYLETEQRVSGEGTEEKQAVGIFPYWGRWTLLAD